MPVDEGVRDAYLTLLKGHLDKLRNEREQLRTRIDCARLADQAWLELPAEQRDALLSLNVQRENVQELVARRQVVVSQMQALQAFIDFVKAAV